MQLRGLKPSHGVYSVHAYWLGAASILGFLLLGVSLIELLKTKGSLEAYAAHSILVIASMGLCIAGAWMFSRKFLVTNERVEIFSLFGMYRIGVYARKHITVCRVYTGKSGGALSISFRTVDGKHFSVGVGAKNWQRFLDWINNQ